MTTTTSDCVRRVVLGALALALVPSGLLRAAAAPLRLPDCGARRRGKEEAAAAVRELTSAGHPGVRALSRGLVHRARTAADPAVRHATFDEAAMVAALGGETALAFAVVEQTCNTFPEIRGPERKRELLRQVVRTARCTVGGEVALSGAAEGCLLLAGDALEQREFAAARDAAKAAKEAAARARDPGLVAQAVEAAARSDAVESAERRARKTLDAGGVPGADWSFEVGRILCLFDGRWEKGLSLLREGSDPAFAEAAAKDLEAPTLPAEQAALADLWWGLAATERWVASRRSLRRRAGYWYWRALQSGIDAKAGHRLVARVTSRLARLRDTKDDSEPWLEALLSTACLVLTFDALTLRYDESGACQVRDLSGRENHGLVHGAALVKGRAGGALRFDGKCDHVRGLGPGKGFPSGDSPRTIVAWVRSADAGDERGCLFDQGDGGGGFHLALTQRDTDFGPSGDGSLKGSTPIRDGRWHHIVGVYEGSRTGIARLYVDGREVTAAPLARRPIASAATWMVGRFLAGDWALSGDIDELLVFARALSADEVLLLSTQTGSAVSSVASRESR